MGANPGSLISHLFFITLPLSHIASPDKGNICKHEHFWRKKLTIPVIIDKFDPTA
jgi:hypothetical protein